MDGFEIAMKVRQSQPHLPTLFTSGYPLANSQYLSEAGPSDFFLDKPFSPKQLVQRVEDLLGVFRQPTSLAA
jgi:CheY-like chemotaxis protein